MTRSIPLSILALLPLVGCASSGPPPAEEVGFWRGADVGVERRELRGLSRDLWSGWLSWHPTEASSLGDPAQLGRWPSTTEAVRGRWEEDVALLRTKLALIDRDTLSTPDRLTAEQLDMALRRESIVLRHRLDRWLIDPVEGPHVRFLQAAAEQPARTARQREQLLSRWRGFARAIDELELDAAAEARSGYVASRGVLERNVDQIDALLAQPTLGGPLIEPACGGGRWVDFAANGNIAALAQRELGDPLRQDELTALNPHLLEPETRARGTYVLLPSPTDDLSPAERGAFVAEVRRVIDTEIRPALDAWRDALAFDLALRAPRGDQPGFLARPGGTGIYADLVWVETTLRTDPGALSTAALEELEDLEDELAAIAPAALGVDDVAQARQLLRGGEALFLPNATAVEAALRAELQVPTTTLGAWFNRVPRASLVVRTDERLDRDLIEALSYRPPSVDASRPGRLSVDVGADRQPTYAIAAAAFGEGVPGRHFVRQLLRERGELPLFRRYAGPDVLERGWVDYAEGLADEMGLYASDVERVGRLTRAIERRALAVADVGLHVEGWSRDDARTFLRERTFASPAEVSARVDLLLGRPAAALAPVAGSLAIRRLRAASERTLRDDFDIRAFHDALTADGPIDLTWLAERVGDWGGFDGRGALGF